MSKFRNHFRVNWRLIVTLSTMGWGLAFWVIPHIFTRPGVKSTLALNPSPMFLLFSSILFLLALSFAYKHLLAFLVRYKNNKQLSVVPFTYIDGIFLLLGSVVISGLFFQERILGNISLSESTKLWLVILGVLFVGWWCIVINKASKARLPKNQAVSRQREPLSPDFFPDEPITNQTEDLFDREQFVEDLYDQITKYPSADSFVFGLYGKWGEGKTSVLNLLRNKLDQSDDVIVFDFDPWYFSSQDALIKSFYQGLYRSLNQRFFLPNLKRVFSKYQKLLTSGLKLSGINIELPSSDESQYE